MRPNAITYKGSPKPHSALNLGSIVLGVSLIAIVYYAIKLSTERHPDQDPGAEPSSDVLADVVTSPVVMSVALSAVLIHLT